MKKKVFIIKSPGAIDDLLGTVQGSGRSGDSLGVESGSSDVGDGRGEEMVRRKRGPRPYTEPWTRMTVNIGVMYRDKLDSFVDRRRSSGDYTYNMRKAIERAIDLLLQYEKIG